MEENVSLEPIAWKVCTRIHYDKPLTKAAWLCTMKPERKARSKSSRRQRTKTTRQIGP